MEHITNIDNTVEESVNDTITNIKPKVCIEDVNYPGIFIKRYAKGENEQSKHKRTYDRRHACVFYGKLKTNIQTLLEHAHNCCVEVKKMHEFKTQICEMKENDGRNFSSAIYWKLVMPKLFGNIFTHKRNFTLRSFACG